MNILLVMIGSNTLLVRMDCNPPGEDGLIFLFIYMYKHYISSHPHQEGRDMPSLSGFGHVVVSSDLLLHNWLSVHNGQEALRGRGYMVNKNMRQ